MSSFVITAKKPIDVFAMVAEFGDASVFYRDHSFSLSPGESRGGFDFFVRVRTTEGDWIPEGYKAEDQAADCNWGTIRPEADTPEV